MDDLVANTALERLRGVRILFYGLPLWHTRQSGLAKWFFSVERVLETDYRLDLGHLALHNSMLDGSLGNIPVLGSLYSLLVATYRIQREETIVHVLSQTKEYHRMLEFSKKPAGPTRRVKTILTVHDILDSKGSELASIQKKVEFADAVFVPSEYTRLALARRTSFAGPICLVPNPVDVKVFRSFSPESKAQERRRVLRRLELPEETRLILYVGSELPRKNLEGLFTMFSYCRSRTRNAALLVVSRPTRRRSSLRALAASMEIAERVRWVDHVSDDELVRFYNASGVFVTLSLGEGFCMPVIESMACGTPVVASNLTALPETVGTGGLLVDPFDLSSVTEKVCDLLDSRDIGQRLVEAGAKRVEALRPELVAAKYIGAYTRVLEDTR